MKTIFDIGTDTGNTDETTLLLETGRGYCCTAFLQKKSAAISHVRLISFDPTDAGSVLPKIIHALSDRRFASVVVCSAYPQALLFPFKYFKKDYSALSTLYDLPAQAYFYDNIEDWQMVNAYGVPEMVYDTVTDAFSDVGFFHCYTPAIKVYNGAVADHQMSVHFTETHMRVLLKKDMAVHLVQTYQYQTPVDVLYNLLKICREFQLSQQDVLLILSGLVEKESGLYKELQPYFSHMQFAQKPEISLPNSQYPHHYFTSIYNLAACVL